MKYKTEIQGGNVCNVEWGASCVTQTNIACARRGITNPLKLQNISSFLSFFAYFFLFCFFHSSWFYFSLCKTAPISASKMVSVGSSSCFHRTSPVKQRGWAVSVGGMRIEMVDVESDSRSPVSALPLDSHTAFRGAASAGPQYMDHSQN